MFEYKKCSKFEKYSDSKKFEKNFQFSKSLGLKKFKTKLTGKIDKTTKKARKSGKPK
jgi:hypothetical protein